MQFRFVTVPAPATICVDRNIGKGVETEAAEAAVTLGIEPVPRIAVSKMKDVAFPETYRAANRHLK